MRTDEKTNLRHTDVAQDTRHVLNRFSYRAGGVEAQGSITSFEATDAACTSYTEALYNADLSA